MTNEQETLVEQVRDAIRKGQSGGCRVLTKGDECDCPLCAFDALLASAPSAPQPLHQRGWDLLRQMRSNLLDDNLISREEYAWLLAEAPGASDKPGAGSPAPRRLESYDQYAARLKYVEGQLKALCKVMGDADGVKKLIAERDEARQYRSDEFDLRMAAETRVKELEAKMAGVQPSASQEEPTQANSTAMIERHALALMDDGSPSGPDECRYVTLAMVRSTIAAAVAEALSSSAPVESPILAFQVWVEQRATTRGPMTQDEYFLAQEAFFAAHPGKGPQSSTMAAPAQTQEERADAPLDADDEAFIDRSWEQFKAADAAAKGSPRDIIRAALEIKPATPSKGKEGR